MSRKKKNKLPEPTPFAPESGFDFDVDAADNGASPPDVPEDAAAPAEETSPLTAAPDGSGAEEAATDVVDETDAEAAPPEGADAAEAGAADGDGAQAAGAAVPRSEYASLKPPPGSYAYVPYESLFTRLFGRSRFFGVTSVLTGAYALFWIVLYCIMLLQRSMLFSQAQLTMASRGETAYSLTFSSPLLTALRVMLYVLPVVLLLWLIALKKAERNRMGFGSRKTVVAILCLLLFMGALSLFDLGAAGLVFDIMKK